MWRIPGPWVRTCQGLRRRDLLQVGGLGLFSLSLPQLLAPQPQAATFEKTRHRSFGKAKSVLIVFLSGGASHLDTFDMKPNAPPEIRGEFQTIDSVVPGIQVCEHLPLIARHTDKLTTLRSLSHRDHTHPSSVYWMLTGHEYPRPTGLSEHLSRDDHPHIGSALAAVEAKLPRAVPPFVTLPDSMAVNGTIRAGQHAGYLGGKFDPLVPQGNPNQQDFQPIDLGLAPCINSSRQRRRQQLLRTLEQQRPHLSQTPTGRQLGDSYQKAYDLLASGVTHRAFDIQAEPDAVRERYGRNLFGQSVLLGRRLVEAGVRLVQVNWIRILEAGWDTHADNFSSLKHQLLPPMDRAFSALLDDLSTSGLLDETLVIMMGEFGRSPKVTPATAGREHWPSANSIQLAGAGIPGGHLYGATDRDGAYVVDRRLTPADLTATLFHALGIDPHREITTPLQRPHQLSPGDPALDLWD